MEVVGRDRYRGNENLGAARQLAPQYSAEGIGIDVVPVRPARSNDVTVERIILPPVTKRGETIDARVVVNNDVVETATIRLLKQAARQQGPKAGPLDSRKNFGKDIPKY